MKISSAIGGSALAVLIVVMLISVVSIYDTAYGTLSTISMGPPNIQVNNDSVVMNMNVTADNRGLVNTELFTNNGTYEFVVGQQSTYTLSTPLKLSYLYGDDWPIHNATYPVTFPMSVVSYFFNTTLSVGPENISIPAPFYGFKITKIVNTSGGSNFTHQIFVEFTDYLPLPSTISKITISSDGGQIGSIPLPQLTYGNFFNVSGYLSSNTVNAKLNLTFSAGPISWVVNDVSI